MSLHDDITLRSDYERLVLQGLAQEWQNAVASLPLDYHYHLRQPAFEIIDVSSKWGEWDGRRRRIALSWRLVTEYPWMTVRGVLLHEMAHQVAEEMLDWHGEPHGEPFRRACHLLQADPRASHDYLSIQEALLHEEETDEDRVLARVRKLLALGSSSHQHEAEAAIAKAHELIARHNLDLQSGGTPLTYCSMSLGEPAVRHAPADYTLGHLLRDFHMVETIWISAWSLRSAKMGRILEISGSRENVLMASYVYDFLQRTITEQWQIAGAAHRYAVRRRHDFSLGVLQGFRERLTAKDKELSQERADLRALISHRDPELRQYFRERYPHIRSTASGGGRVNPEAHATGLAVGRQTEIAPPIARQPSAPKALPAGRCSSR